MALWNTFVWSDGTKWADANGAIRSRTAFIDRSAHSISLRITHTHDGAPGSLASMVVLTPSLEVGVRSQQPHLFEAFVDRHQEAQRISFKVSMTADNDTESPPSIDSMMLVSNTRSRRQPS